MRGPPSIFGVATRRGGPDIPQTSYKEFVDYLRQFSEGTCAPGLISLAWLGWMGKIKDPPMNALARAYGDRLSAIAAAVSRGSEPFNVAKHGADVLARFLAVRDAFSIPGLLSKLADDLFRAARSSKCPQLIPSLEIAEAALPVFSLGRLLRAQWATQHAQLDDLVRTWWLAKRIDERAGSGHATGRLLGMETHMLFRSAYMLLMLAMTEFPPGRINTHRVLDEQVREKYGMGDEELRLCANRLAVSTEDLVEWHDNEVLFLPEGFRQFAPTPLGMSPLIAVPLQGVRYQHYLGASPPAMIAATTHIVREAASRVDGQVVASTSSVYGYVLEDYVEQVCQHHLGRDNVYRVSQWEGPEQTQADLLIRAGASGLLLEVKRSLASIPAKEIMDTVGILAVSQKIYDAHRQCAATFQRKPWRRTLGVIDDIAAIILVDDSTAGASAATSWLIDCLGPVSPYFEVMSVSEFEDMLPIVGVEACVRLIRQKWLTGHGDLPLRLFASKVRGRAETVLPNAKRYLQPESEELLVGVGLDETHQYAARWP